MDGKTSIWQHINSWVYQSIGSLLTDQKQNKITLSLGRVALLLVLSQMIYFWHTNSNSDFLPDNMIEVFLILAGYVLGTKIVSALDRKWQTKPKTTSKKK